MDNKIDSIITTPTSRVRRPKKNPLLALMTPSFYRVKKTQLEMMIDRGYVVEDEEWDAMTSLETLKDAVIATNVMGAKKKTLKPKTIPAKTIKRKINAPDTPPSIVSTYNPLYVEYHANHPTVLTPSLIVSFVLPQTDKDIVGTDSLLKRGLLAAKTGKVSRLIAIYFPTKGNKRRIVPEVSIDAEEFEFSFLEVNPYRTAYNDVHTLMTKTERDAWCLENGYYTAEMSGISSENATVRYLGARAKDVIRVDSENILPFFLSTFISWYEVRNVPVIFSAMESEQDGDVVEDDEDGDDDAPEGEDLIEHDIDDTIVV